MRLAHGFSLARLAAMIPMSEATLSRIENGLSDITAKNLYALATALDAHIEDFFIYRNSSKPAGLRSITRAGCGIPFRSGAFDSRLLSPDLSSKKMTPFLNSTTAQTVAEAGGLNAHPGEEFLLIIDGCLKLHTEYYEPLELGTGDSIYFDATTPHAYVSSSGDPAQFLVVTSQPATMKDSDH